MTRAALYARFSTDKQSEASLGDQHRVCEARAAAEGWTIVARPMSLQDELLAFLRRHHPDMALRLSDDARWSGAFGHSIAGRLPATPLEAATYEAREEAFVAGYRAAAIAFGRAPSDPRAPPALEAVSGLTGERQSTRPLGAPEE